jgi:branched-subunit amino acid ABC-type transport system permease component
MLQPVLQALLNGLVSGTLLAVPAIGFTAIFAVLRYPNFAIGALATVGAYAGWMANVQLGCRSRRRSCSPLPAPA